MDKIDGKFVSPFPQIKDRKMARFGFCAASSLIGVGVGVGMGFAVPINSDQDCRLLRSRLSQSHAMLPIP